MCCSLAAEAGLTAGRLLPLLLPTPPFVLPPQIYRGNSVAITVVRGTQAPPAGSAAAAAQRLLKQAPVFLNYLSRSCFLDVTN